MCVLVPMHMAYRLFSVVVIEILALPTCVVVFVNKADRFSFAY